MHLPFFDTLALIDDTVPRTGAMNMALDEVLLGGLAETPILRCYRWREREVSFGCFGRAASAEDGYPGVPKVRRWTGGGLVEHGDDFTFTLLVPKSLTLARLPAADSYQRIHEALGVALRAAGLGGLDAAPGNAVPAATPPADAPFLTACFSHPVEHDLLSHGEKIAGGAQRRTRRGLMHQGSVQSRRGVSILGDSVRVELPRLLTAAFATGAAARVVTHAELAQAETLAAWKYGTAAWTERF